MIINIVCWLAIALFVLPDSSLAEKMTAQKVIQNCVASYEKQMKGVRDITIVTNWDITYHKWTTIKEKTICKTRYEMGIIGMGVKFITIYDGIYQWQQNPLWGVTKERIDYDPYQTIENLKTTPAQYGGTEKIYGHKTHILDIKDIAKLIAFPTVKQEGTEIVRASGKLWVDAKDWVIRKTEVDIECVDGKGQKRTGKTTIEKRDFRRDNGLLIPYCTVMTTPPEGILSPEEQKQKPPWVEIRREPLVFPHAGWVIWLRPPTPEEEQEWRERQARKRVEEMRRGLEESRKMLEEIMEPQQIEMMLEMTPKILAGGEIGVVSTVKDVKINTGLPDDLFDGSKLK